MIATAIELFAGCGGMSTGILDAGVAVRLGTDLYPPALRTFDFNHGYRGVTALVEDVRRMNGRQLLDAANIRYGSLKLLAGGPPCQPFSIIGKQGGLSDPRGDLVFEYVRILRETAPEAFIFENVARLATVHDGHVLETLLAKLRKAGYATSHGVLNAADYGVAQMRKRLIIVGVRGSEPLPFPPPATHGTLGLLGQAPYVTCRAAIGDLPDVNTPEAAQYPNHEATHHSEAMLEAFRSLPPGKRDKKSHHDRLHPDRLGYTLRAGTGNFSPLRPVHYKYDRVISVRESARLQSFRDDFVWPHDVPRLQQYRQVGNAVPPELARALTAHLSRQLSWQLDIEALRGDKRKRERLRPVSIVERESHRRSLIRGASLGRESSREASGGGA